MCISSITTFHWRQSSGWYETQQISHCAVLFRCSAVPLSWASAPQTMPICFPAGFAFLQLQRKARWFNRSGLAGGSCSPTWGQCQHSDSMAVLPSPPLSWKFVRGEWSELRLKSGRERFGTAPQQQENNQAGGLNYGLALSPPASHCQLFLTSFQKPGFMTECKKVERMMFRFSRMYFFAWSHPHRARSH